MIFISSTTKKALAIALKQQLKDKPLEKITISDLCSACEVNRQTFYYHFHDIYALIEWIYTRDAYKVLDGKTTYHTWEEGFFAIFEYALQEKDFVITTYHSISREHLETFLFHETYKLLYDVIHEMSQSISIKEEDKAFIAHFYKYAFVGMLLDWIRKGMHQDYHKIVSQSACLLEGDFADAIQRFKQ